jgi:molybdate transport repressor ModE-like protein
MGDAEPRRYFKELRFRQLRALVLLARKGSFSAVAQELQIAVPSVWQQIRALEEEFETPMVRQAGRGVALTPQGELLVQMAQPLVDDFARLRTLFAEKSRALPPQITVATTESLLLHELQRPLAVLREQHPGIALNFLDRPSTIARRHLEQGEADLAIVGQIEEGDSSSLRVTPLTEYPFLLICAEGHPLLRVRKVGMADLVKYPLVIPGEASNSRLRVQRVLEAGGCWAQARLALTASTFQIVAGYVRMGFGIGLGSTSRLVLEQAAQGHPDYRGVVFRDVSELFGVEQIVLLQRRSKMELPHHRTFCEVLQKTIQPESV